MTTRALVLSPAGRRQVRWVLIGAAALGLALGVQTLLRHVTQDPLSDARAYYLAGQRLNAGLPLYHQPGATIAETYIYPPLLAIAFRPLSLAPEPVALAVWETLMVGALAVLLRPALRDRRALFAALFLAAPIAWAISIGQGEILVAALLSLATPWSVALAGHLKLFPWLASLYWLVVGDVRTFLRFVAWSVAFLAVQLLLAPQATFDYLGLEWLHTATGVESMSPWGIHPLLYVAVLVVVLGGLIRYRRTAATWPLTIAFVVLAYPRLLLYQLTTLMAAFGEPRRTVER
jgi:hypothetical protein